MNIKESKPYNALVFRVETTLLELSNHVAHVAKSLYREAVRLDLMVTGAIHWNYYGIDGQPDTKFLLEIALPIQEKEVVSSEFEWRRIAGFKCVSAVLEGPWEQLPKIYETLIRQLHAQGLHMTDECREMYINMDFETPENNITEVQVGVR